MTPQGVARAAQKAYKQAQIASQHSIYEFDETARPSFQGNYQSPYTKIVTPFPQGSLMNFFWTPTII